MRTSWLRSTWCLRVWGLMKGSYEILIRPLATRVVGGWWGGGIGRRCRRTKVNTRKERRLSTSINHVKCRSRGILSAQEAQFCHWAAGKKMLSKFHMCCNEFLIYSPEKSKWEIGYLRLCLSCFITFTCAGLHIGILSPFFFHLSSRDRWRRILAALHLLSERFFCSLFFLHGVVCLLSGLCSEWTL